MNTDGNFLMRKRPFAYSVVFAHPKLDGPAFGPNGNIKPEIDPAIAPVCKNESNCTVFLTDGRWFTTWSQGSYEHALDEGIVFSISGDMGRSWTEPKPIVRSTREERRSYGAPLVVPGNGRIYLFIHAGNQDVPMSEPYYDSGNLHVIYSDDSGETWSPPRQIDLPGKDIDIFPARFHGWINHPPQLMPSGEVILPFGRTQRAGLTRRAWILAPAEVNVLRCDNILTEHNLDSLEFTLLPEGPKGIRAAVASNLNNPALNRLTAYAEGSPAESAYNFQEMTVVPLTGDRWLGVGRTFLGSPGYTLSADRGRTWSTVERLRYAPDGAYIDHPMTMCPITKTNDGRVILLFTNNDGSARGALHVWDGNGRTRNPQYLAVGREIPGETRNAGLMFGSPLLVAEVDDSGETNLKTGISMPQFFERNGRYFVMYNVNKEHILLDEIPAAVLDGVTP